MAMNRGEMIGDNPNDQVRPENELKNPAIPKVAGTFYQEHEFFRTEAQQTEEGTIPYPEESEEPDTYYARKLRNVKFDKEQGSPPLTYDLTEQFVFIKNMAAETYLEENTICLGWPKNGQWFTIDPKKGKANDYGMVAYTFGSYVVVLDDRDGSIVWGPTLITHAEYTEHPTESYWLQFEGGWSANPNSSLVDGMTYLRAMKVRFDRFGNLFVAYDLIRVIYDADGFGAGLSPSFRTGAVVKSGMVRFSYDVDNRTFNPEWQADYSKRFLIGDQRVLVAMGWKRPTLPSTSTWAAFDVDDETGDVFYAAQGWPTEDSDESIQTVEHLRQLYDGTVNTQLLTTYMIKADAETGELKQRWIAGQTGIATQLVPDEQQIGPIGLAADRKNFYPFPIGIGQVITPGNGRVYVMSRAVGDYGESPPTRFRRDESTLPRVTNGRLMQFTYDGEWRHAGETFGGGYYDRSAQHYDIAFEWNRDSAGEDYRLFGIVGVNLNRFSSRGNNQLCDAFLAANDQSAIWYGAAVLLIEQANVEEAATGRAWEHVRDELEFELYRYVMFNYCQWLRGGTHGFPIERPGYGNSTFAFNQYGLVDINDNVGILAVNGLGLSYADTAFNNRRSNLITLDRNLQFQPFPVANQLSLYSNNGSGLGFEGFNNLQNPRYQTHGRYDSNDDGGGGDGSIIWAFPYSADESDPDYPNATARDYHVYKVNQDGAIVWGALGDEYNMTHSLFDQTGQAGQVVALPGQGLGTSCDVYDPRENPKSPEHNANFKGRRFVPPVEARTAASPPEPD